jgi:integrase
MSASDSKADWTLLSIVNELMKPSGRYTKHRIRAYRAAVRRYNRFRGSEQTAGEVTTRLLEKFKEWMVTEQTTMKCAIETASNVCSVVRQADPTLIPNRKIGEYSKLQKGDLFYIMENEYFSSKPKIASENTERQYKYAFTRYSRFLGRRATLDDLTDLSFGKWMRSMRRDGLAIPTINGYVTHLRAFWSWCAWVGIVDVRPTIEDFPEPVRIPDSYTEEETRRLVAATALMEGEILGVPASAWWEALHRVALDTGERTNALLNVQWCHLNTSNGTLVVPAEIRKGGRKPMCYYPKPKTLAALELIREPRRKKIFAADFDPPTFSRRYRKLIELAGLTYIPHKSGLQKIRRTFASHVEANGGNATMALAHTSRRLTEKSYLDPRIVKEPPHNEHMFDV